MTPFCQIEHVASDSSVRYPVEQPNNRTSDRESAFFESAFFRSLFPRWSAGVSRSVIHHRL
jgi:hypothetical protein